MRAAPCPFLIPECWCVVKTGVQMGNWTDFGWQGFSLMQNLWCNLGVGFCGEAKGVVGVGRKLFLVTMNVSLNLESQYCIRLPGR